MKIRLGDILIAKSGDYYRVVEFKEGIVTLMRVNGYTLFSCSIGFAESSFQILRSSVVV
jgi:hypothetical protein